VDTERVSTTSTTHDKLLTIVCATKNAGSTAEKLLFSYAAQKTDRTELDIIDSCSVDDTLVILDRYREYIDQILVENDHGIYEAWNKGIRLATGEFVSFVGADDTIASGAIDELLSTIDSRHDVDYIFGYNVSTTNGIPSKIIGRPYSLQAMEKYMPMAHVMSAHRRVWLVEKGMFDESYKSSGDYDFLLRTRKSMRFIESKKIFAYVEDNGISRRSAMPLFEAFRAKRRHGVGRIKSTAWLVRGLTGHLIRHFFVK